MATTKWMLWLLAFSQLLTARLAWGQPAISAGVLGGVGISELADGTSKPSSERGFSIGLFAESKMRGGLALELQPGYDRVRAGLRVPVTTIGSDPGGGGGVVPVTTQGRGFVTLDALSLPILLKLKWDLGAFSPYVLAGPSVRWILHSKITLPGDVPGPERGTNALAVAIDAGAGVGYALSPANMLRFDALYSHGLTNIFSSDPSSSGVKVRGVRLLVGVGWAL